MGSTETGQLCIVQHSGTMAGVLSARTVSKVSVLNCYASKDLRGKVNGSFFPHGSQFFKFFLPISYSHASIAFEISDLLFTFNDLQLIKHSLRQVSYILI